MNPCMLISLSIQRVLLVILLTGTAAASDSDDLHPLYAPGVPPCPEEIVEEVEDAERRKEPVEEVEPVLVEVVVGKPAAAAIACRGGGATGDPVDERHEHGAEVEAEGVGAVGHGGQEGLHAGERLLVEELDEPDGGEHLREPEHQELRRYPEDGEEPSAVRGVAAPGLDERGGDHGEGDGEEADADALERGDPRGDAREAAHGGDEGGLVRRDERHEHDVGDRLQRRRRDVEAGGGEPGVHGAALLHGEGLQLRQNGVEHDGAREDGHHAQQQLHLLHLRRRAQTPRAFLRPRRRPAGAVRRLHAGLVQEP